MAKAKKTKVGMIFECGPDGADEQVCRFLAHCLNSSLDSVPVTLDNKPGLLRSCGPAASQLLADGCAQVLIIWDLFPPWREKGVKPCRRDDRSEIFDSLMAAGVPPAKVALVCIREELEAWLIADGRGISSVLSTPQHPVQIGHAKKPERMQNPKKVLNRLFQEHIHRPYVDRQHALQIARSLPDLSRLQKLQSFARFRQKLLGMS